eukprot:scaffold266433_cov35-Tisochrysis_lutea.AAC.1
MYSHRPAGGSRRYDRATQSHEARGKWSILEASKGRSSTLPSAATTTRPRVKAEEAEADDAAIGRLAGELPRIL